ncbi:type II toxin-antitoxin system VapC family toxin [Humibacter soli]
MPTSADLLLDTSVAVALSLSTHARHDEAMTRTRGQVLGLAGHAQFETYSVLTRLPAEQRLSAGSALRLIETNFPQSYQLSAKVSSHALRTLSDAGIHGGTVYDGLVGLAAREAGVILLTCDRRALATYSALGVSVEFL